jgi:hypothetical protein
MVLTTNCWGEHQAVWGENEIGMPEYYVLNFFTVKQEVKLSLYQAVLAHKVVGC